MPRSKPPNIGEPTKNAIEIRIPKAIPTRIKRLFMIQPESPKIKSNTLAHNSNYAQIYHA